MRYLAATLLVIMTLFGAALLAGCGSQEPVQQQDATTPNAAASNLPAEVEAELAKLPDGDRQLALQQRVCPVSGELLGSMGKPIKVTVEGRDVFLCCAGCEEQFRADPEKYFRQLDQQNS